MSILSHDDLDTRKEMWRLLDDPRMTDQTRFLFVNMCLAKTPVKIKFRLAPMRGNVYTTAVAWDDLVMLSTDQMGGDLAIFLLDLVTFVRAIHK